MKLRVSDVEPPTEGWECFDTGDMADMWSNDDKRSDKIDFFSSFDEIIFNESELNDILDWSFEPDRKDIVHHDCMWSGTCSDKYHPGNIIGPCPNASPTPPPKPAPTPTPVPVQQQQLLQPPQPQQQQQPPQQQTVQQTPPGRSLLISAARPQTIVPLQRPIHKKTAVPRSPPSPRRPDTPQSLDEEDPPRFKQEYEDRPTRPIGKKVIPDYDVDDDDDDGDEEADDDDDDDGYEEDDYRHSSYQNIRSIREHTIATDHSYTLSKNSKPNRVDLPGVQTPSDSEEEIDVVSLGEKMVGVGRGPVALPANPSPLARRQLQRTMASAVAERSGLSARHAPPQPRKRARDRSASPLLRHRKRAKPMTKPRFHQSASRHSPPKRRPYSSPNSDSEAENIERRSLHNDMERQRRIGLKNLFDELKKEVPSICHKDRAPKVVVLREAASLCIRLQREEREMEQLKAKQQRLLAQVRQLRVDLASRRPKNA